jgi:hypothetical protein
MKYSNLIPAALGVAVLAGCGGGGGGSTDASAGSGQGSVSVSGTAAKGLMANADVGAFAVAADGSVGTTALATTTTDASGHYALSFNATQDKPYVIKVSAKADGSTTHLDEVTNTSQALPAGFTMRALLVPTTAGAVTTSASITPFSELAVAAAAKASGGITKANADQAASAVAQLLGFDPSKVAVKAASAAGSSEDEKKLAIMLTAVSKLADSGALGCATGAAGDKVKCVVDTLASAASSTSIKLEVPGTDVSAALGSAVSTVLADTTLSGGIDPSTLSAVTSNLACTESCAAAPVATVSAITSAKALFTQLRSDWTALFSRGGASAIATGAANTEAWKFRQAMTGVQLPATTLVKDLGVLLMAVDFYNDYKAGRTTANFRTRAPGEVASDTPWAVTNYTAVGCTVYQDSATTVVATLPENANFVGCRASYFVSSANGTTTDWRHGFTITPNGGGAFGYTTRARKRVTTNGVLTENLALQTNFYAGNLTTNADAQGRVTQFAVSGDLAASFKLDTTTLADDHATWALSGSRSITGVNSGSATVTGQITSYDASAAVLGSLTVNTGAITEIAISRDVNDNPVKPGSAGDVGSYGGTVDSVSLDLVWATPTAAFQGVFTTQPTVWDVSGTNRAPVSASLSGALRNIEGGVTTEFLKGSFSATAAGYGSYNHTLVSSPTNYYTTSAQFIGTVTAPTRPTLELTIAASKKSYETQVAGVNMGYRVLVAGAPRTVIAITGTRAVDGTMGWTLAEATAGLSLSWNDMTTRANLLKGGDVIGVLDKGSKLLTFSDHSVLSLDVGL